MALLAAIADSLADAQISPLDDGELGAIVAPSGKSNWRRAGRGQVTTLSVKGDRPLGAKRAETRLIDPNWNSAKSELGANLKAASETSITSDLRQSDADKLGESAMEPLMRRSQQMDRSYRNSNRAGVSCSLQACRPRRRSVA